MNFNRKWSGEMRSCIIYCVLEIIINLLEHVPQEFFQQVFFSQMMTDGVRRGKGTVTVRCVLHHVTSPFSTSEGAYSASRALVDELFSLRLANRYELEFEDSSQA